MIVDSSEYHIHELVRFYVRHGVLMADLDLLLTAPVMEMINKFEINKNIYPNSGMLKWNLGVERYRKKNDIQTAWRILSYLYKWAEDN